MALKVEIIKKIHKNRKLVGYKVRDEKGNEMDIDKDAVKDAIKSGKVEVTNMTVTSDGRILGAAKPSVNKDMKKEIEYRLVEVYTYNDNIVGAMVDESEAVDAGIIDEHDITGLSHGYTFETADTVIDRMTNNIYSNMNISDDNIEGDIKRVSIESVRDSMLNLLRANEIVVDSAKIDQCISINEQAQECLINNPVESSNETLCRVAMVLLTYTLYKHGYNIKYVNDTSVSIYTENNSGCIELNDIYNTITDAFN